MKITTPLANAQFKIAGDTTPPAITFKTDATGAHVWTWKIVWGAFSKSGTVNTATGTLELKAQLADLGGTLTVSAAAGGITAQVAVSVIGTNPAMAAIEAYLATKPNSDGFAAIIKHESKGLHFNPSGQPVKSFDNGYGLCQLTTPAPSFEQCWSWKRNIDAGLVLFAAKQTSARTYLSQSGRTYTAAQLRYETVCRWNGGSYHRFVGGKWVRNPAILCDARTGNIGWDMTDPDNAGQTEAQLRARDKGTYARGHKNTDEWNYFGVCYADAILN
jgi:hypothetical protein